VHLRQWRAVRAPVGGGASRFRFSGHDGSSKLVSTLNWRLLLIRLRVVRQKLATVADKTESGPSETESK
jgi:hypothetical protein